MADQLRGDALFSYAVEHYLDTVYRAAFHAARFCVISCSARAISTASRI